MKLTAFLAALAVSLIGTAAQAQERIETSIGPVLVEQVAGPLEQPWALAFLPDGALLVTERGGTLRLIRDGQISRPIAGVPEVAARGQGGLLDIAPDPDFARTRRVFFSYAEPADGKARTALGSGILSGNAQRLDDVRVLFRQDPAIGGGRHFGSRIVFKGDGTLFLTTGDRGDRERAQHPGGHIGKVIRIGLDGAIPADNPFVGDPSVRDEIWSIGHRNIQGAALRPSDGALFTISHGARGGDEVNRPEAGRNYGWPVISYGRHYSGFKIGEGASKPGMEQPLWYWDPSIAPSGATFYNGDLFPEWRGNLFVGGLKFGIISRLTVEGDRVEEAERMLDYAFGRIRDVRTGPDGALWFVTDEADGGVYRMTPAN